ncbi:MAG: hypothetical protein EPO20_00985 [Betaproteobacteria bacterium]|nr:MAG: hypothetical protein EPO20_00985 [Betaproteobacteria bacterium]
MLLGVLTKETTHLHLVWYRDRRAWRLIALRFVPWFAGLSLAWEIAQLPLYTIWAERTPGYIAFSVAHCTAGDILIGMAALLLALVLLRTGSLGSWRWGRIGTLAALLGAAYTVFSEWRNIAILGSWAYAASMPRIEVGGMELGLSPLLQWFVLPPLAVYLTRRSTRSG